MNSPSANRIWISALVSLALLTGCITSPQHPAATQPSTAIDPATTQPSYWNNQPATEVANGIDFDRMVAACEDVARRFLFKLDRVDFRAGLVTTEPLVSGQWFEPWRRDNRTVYDVEESSLASIRRTIRFEFTRLPDMTWEVAPKVLVERQAIAERRITSVVLYRNVFLLPRGRARQTGSIEADEGIVLPSRYWYPLRRDPEFERAIATGIRERLQRQ